MFKKRAVGSAARRVAVPEPTPNSKKAAKPSIVGPDDGNVSLSPPNSKCVVTTAQATKIVGPSERPAKRPTRSKPYAVQAGNTTYTRAEIDELTVGAGDDLTSTYLSSDPVWQSKLLARVGLRNTSHMPPVPPTLGEVQDRLKSARDALAQRCNDIEEEIAAIDWQLVRDAAREQ